MIYVITPSTTTMIAALFARSARRTRPAITPIVRKLGTGEKDGPCGPIPCPTHGVIHLSVTNYTYCALTGFPIEDPRAVQAQAPVTDCGTISERRQKSSVTPSPVPITPMYSCDGSDDDYHAQMAREHVLGKADR